MPLTIDLTAEQEDALRQEAARLDLEPSVYAQRLIAANLLLKAPHPRPLWNTLSPEEWEQYIDAWLEGNQSLPVLSDYAVSRENMYEGRE